jgi:polysaccharide export outer membrane protein
MLRSAFLLLIMAVFASSCSVNKDFMFKTDIEYVYDVPMLDSTNKEFKLSPTDLLNVAVYTNEGAIVFEATSSRERMMLTTESDVSFLVESDGYVELPILGRVLAQGMTIQEFQKFVEEKFESQFVKPFCITKVINRRVLVFNGQGSAGTVVPLMNNNIRLIEALALAGGLGQRANASKIKVIRQAKGDNLVYFIDLSTIEGLDMANMIVQNGDVIYVESTKNLGSEAVNDVTPVITLLSSVFLLIGIFSAF